MKKYCSHCGARVKIADISEEEAQSEYKQFVQEEAKEEQRPIYEIENENFEKLLPEAIEFSMEGSDEGIVEEGITMYNKAPFIYSYDSPTNSVTEGILRMWMITPKEYTVLKEAKGASK